MTYIKKWWSCECVSLTFGSPQPNRKISKKMSDTIKQDWGITNTWPWVLSRRFRGGQSHISKRNAPQAMVVVKKPLCTNDRWSRRPAIGSVQGQYKCLLIGIVASCIQSSWPNVHDKALPHDLFILHQIEKYAPILWTTPGAYKWKVSHFQYNTPLNAIA